MLRGTEGIAVLLVIFAVVSAFGFVFFVIDLSDRNRAEEVAKHGKWATVSDVEVHVNRVSGRGGGYYEVDDVRVRIPGTVGRARLGNVWSDMAVEDAVEGWQAPTAVTGYQPPLEVRYVVADWRGEVSSAMARKDLDYWTRDNTDPEVGLGIGIAGLVLTMVALGLNILRLNWLERRLGRLGSVGSGQTVMVGVAGVLVEGVTRRERRLAAIRAAREVTREGTWRTPLWYRVFFPVVGGYFIVATVVHFDGGTDLPMTLLSAVLGIVLTGARWPVVRLAGSALYARGLIFHRTIPVTDIVQVIPGYGGLDIETTDGRHFEATGVGEKWNIAAWLGHRTAADSIADTILAAAGQARAFQTRGPTLPGPGA